ncbi:hamartin-like isoform X2 [Periophthalmus magnuspinnatus]|uniref:hamartin-like isoform X2 n=1 Tax=Periophthalmus magnuspinnatus TaxID=409849 RepID=UPI00243706BF|nr:hamartin-like isoform X2 [Periophthalmus magnuspinnatus]
MSACVLTHGPQVLAMSREPVVLDLSLLEGTDLKEAELVKNSLSLQLNSDRGGTVLTSLVDFYLETFSSQAVSLLSNAREQLHKVLLEKLNDALNKSATRLAAVTLLGHLIRKQPSWVHLVTRCPLLASLLRCLKTDGDAVVLSTGVLVLVTLLPMIPQCGKQLVYDFFDVFGRLASWSLRNPAQVPVLQLLHLQGALYSLFHRLYGMFPVNFLSYLRLHYSMKENTDTFHRVVKPMLDHVRVHPELVTGTQDQELDPTRWRCFEVHDIVMECSRLSLDPLEASSEDLQYFSSSSSLPSLPSLSSLPLPVTEEESSPGPHTSPQAVDLDWSPSSHCGLSTPPPERHAPSTPSPAPSTTSPAPSIPGQALTTTPPTPGSAPSTPRAAPSTPGHAPSTTGPAPSTPVVTSPFQASVPIAPSPELSPVSCDHLQHKQLVTVQDGQSDVINIQSESFVKTRPPTYADHSRLAQGPAHSVPDPSYEALFDLALPRAAPLFVAKKTKEALKRAELDHSPVSPLELLDQLKPVQDLLILQGDHAHQQLLRSAMNKCMDRSSTGPTPLTPSIVPPAVSVEELSIELLLVQNQLQFERFKRQQHAIRNRRLLRRVIQTTALEEQLNAMRAQLGVLEAELRFLKDSLEVEQRRFSELKRHSETTTSQLQAHIQDLSSSQQGALQDKARLQSELLQCQTRLKEQEAELQRANHKAYNAQHQLSQLSIKVSSGEELQQHLFLMNQQLLLLRESNRTLSQALSATGNSSDTEVLLLQGIVDNEVQQLKESEVEIKQALDVASHRAEELENQLALKDQLILDQKRLLEDCKALSRSQLSASESRCVALRSITQSLQTELLHLYSQIQIQSKQGQDQDHKQDWGYSRPQPSASVNIANSANAKLQPLYSPPIESPLTVGSFLEREARRLFGPANQSPETKETTNHSLEEEVESHVTFESKEANHSVVSEGTANDNPVGAGQEEKPTNAPQKEQQAHPSRQSEQAANHSSEEAGLEEEAEEVQEEMLLAASPPNQPQNWAAIGRNSRPGPAHSDLTLAVRQRRLELSLMDYNES